MRWLVALLVSALVCIGCDGSKMPGVPSGPGKLAGSCTFLTPVLATSDSPVVGATNLRYCAFAIPGNIGVFESNSSYFSLKSFYAHEIEYYEADPTQGIWSAAFSFENLPLGELNLRVYDLHTLDWGNYDYYEYYRSSIINLSPGRKRIDGFELTRDMRGAAGRGRIHGKVFINGNPSGESKAQLSFGAHHLDIPAGGANPPSYDQHEHLTWDIPPGSATNGRLFYEVSELGYGNYYTANGIVKEGQPLSAVPGYDFKPGVELSAAYQEAEVDFTSVNHQYPAWEGTRAERYSQRGTILVDLHVDCVASWPGDVVLAAEPSDGSVAANCRAYSHIPPVVVGRSEDYKLRLYYLPAGEYYVRLLLLGETNTDPVTELLSAGLVELEMIEPETITSPWGNTYVHCTKPLLELSLAIEVRTQT